MINSKLQKKSTTKKTTLFLFGGLIGIAAFLIIYGVSPLNFTNDLWILGGYLEKDVLQHHLGWLAYRESPISFPLCIATAINSPAGISVAFTDSIPLFSMFFRLIAFALPQTFQFFGLFVLSCFFLQGGCAAILLGLFVEGYKKPLLASLMFVLSPILIERAFRHTALTAQFLILLALYLYFDAKHKNKIISYWFIGLLALSISIHPYFVPLLFAVLFASLIEYCVKNKKLIKPLIMLLLGFAAVGAVAYSIGYFHTGASRTIGYGYFSMNLNALFNPVSKGVESWSLLLPKWKQGLGTYEGFNYLGLGTLFVLGVMVIYYAINAKKLKMFPRLKAHWGLLLVCLCLSVFAVSNVVTLNSFTLFSVEIPWQLIDICSMLRASGRMFWLCNYLIVLAVCLFLVRRVKPKHTIVVLSAVAVVQCVDMSPALIAKYKYFSNPEPTFISSFTSDFWQLAAQNYNNIFSFEAEGVHDALYLQLLAAQNNMTSNDQFFARHDAEMHDMAVEAEIEKARNGKIDKNTIFVMTRKDLFYRYAGYFIDNSMCAMVDKNWYVFAPWNDAIKNFDTSTQDIFVFDYLPFSVADFTDEDWTGGVWNSDPTLVCFYDSEPNRERLKNAKVILMGTEAFEIENVSYEDAGWILVKLNKNGEPLRGAELGIATALPELSTVSEPSTQP